MADRDRSVTAGPWKDRAEFEAWWKANVVAFNRLSVTNPPEWQRIARAVEEFQTRNPQ